MSTADNEKNWIQIKTECSTNDLDTVSAVMCMLNNGLMIEDYSDVDQALDGVYADLIDESIMRADRTRSAVSVFIPESSSPAETENMLRERFSALGIDARVTHLSVSEEDWAESWKKYYKPIRTGKCLVIVPLWEKDNFKTEPGDITVLMDPGMAFGTGTHETTRLCAALLEDFVTEGCRMIDVGCGSGILAICASKLGAGYCYACDIDPQAVKIARENAKLNCVENMVCEVSDLVSKVNESPFDVAAVNIVADVIIRLAPDVGRFLKDDATLIVSGIIAERAEETIASLDAAGFAPVRELKENGWYAAALKKKRS